MTTKRRKPTIVIYPDSVRPPLKLPDAQSVLNLGFDLSDQELFDIRMGMAIHAISRRPQLTWNGWHGIAVAVAVGHKRFKKAAGGKIKTPAYTKPMSKFYNATGFNFLNKDDIASALRMLPYWAEIDAWRLTLSKSRQGSLNNPRSVEDEYKKRNEQPGQSRPDPLIPDKHFRRPSRAEEQVRAAYELVAELEAQLEQAERDVEYFASVANAMARAGRFDDDAVATIRAQVRARREAEATGE